MWDTRDHVSGRAGLASRIPWACPLVVLGLFMAPSGAAADALSTLNVQRSSNGLPAGIVERSDWSAACAQHVRYMALNDELTHDEDPSKPGYTEEGAWAGRNSVLASGSSWSGGNAFEDAPIHLDQLLAPRLAEIGQSEDQGWVCDTTWPGLTRGQPDDVRIYTYPGDGRTDVPISETPFESPFVPGDFVGLPQGTTTGPNILIFADGPWSYATAQITAASLTGPDGPVEVRWVDNTTPTVGSYLVTGGVVIPVSRLRHGTTYTGSVTLAIDGATASRTWSFSTVPNQSPTADFTVYPADPVAGDRVQLQANASDPDGQVASETWDLGDDGTIDGEGDSLSHVFNSAGSYVVRLRVTDDDGAATDATHVIAVREVPPPTQHEDPRLPTIPMISSDASLDCQQLAAIGESLRDTIIRKARWLHRLSRDLAHRRRHLTSPARRRRYARALREYRRHQAIQRQRRNRLVAIVDRLDEDCVTA